MSEENVEVVRRFYAALNKWLGSIGSEPEQQLEQSPELEEVFDHLDPEAEWDWPLTPETFRGRDRLLQAVADWLQTVTDWHVEPEELIDGSRNRVLVTVRVTAQGKGSGAPAIQSVFSVTTVRNGKVTRIEDHTEKAEALEAAGLSE